MRQSIFLAGSIDNGSAVDWQSKAEKELAKYFTVYNPRRKDWSNSIDPTVLSPELEYQINWELDHITTCSHRFFFISKESKAPISLLELGLVSGKSMTLCVEDGFYRRANIEVVAKRYGINLYNNLEGALSSLAEQEEACFLNLAERYTYLLKTQAFLYSPMITHSLNWVYFLDKYPDKFQVVAEAIKRLHPSLLKEPMYDIRYPR